jgi:hypothetical protein
MSKQDILIGTLAVASTSFVVWNMTKDNSNAKILPDVKSIDQDWIAWYSALKSAYGTKRAKTLWLKRWNIVADKTSSKVNSSDLRDYMEKHAKITLSSEGVWNSIIGATDDVLDTVGNIFGVTKYVAIGAAVLVGIPVFMLLINVARKPELVAGAISPTRGIKL